MIKIEDLIEEAKHGNKDACAKLIESMRSDLYRIAKSKLSNDDDTQDVVQITITKAYFSMCGNKKINNFKAWITTILINECKAVYKKRKRNDDLSQKYIASDKTVDYIEHDLDFENMINSLNEREKEIFELRYVDNLPVKQIARKLHMNENTIKTILSRGRNKIRKAYKPATIFMLILFVLVTTSVIAVSIISYIQSLFELNSVGIDNDGVVKAIEHRNWFQDVNMDYIDMGNGYKIKAEYLLMDEMNLYIVFDITSEKDISKFTDVVFDDLNVTDDNSNIICDIGNTFSESYSQLTSYKIIESNKDSIKVLVYMYTDGFPKSKTLNINFTKFSLAKKLKSKETIDTNVNFSIDLSEKFVNRKYVEYSSNNPKIEKAIITETGFYAIVTHNKLDPITKVLLVDENGNNYKCYYAYLTDYNNYSHSNFKFIIASDFIEIKNNYLKLIIDSTEYILEK